MVTRDLVVIGASAGGVAPLIKLVGGLLADFPAAILIVQHMHPRTPPLLAEILQRSGPLPVLTAKNGERIVPGRILVAAPDLHLIVENERVWLWPGAHENRTRPAIDPLFRSAAVAYRSRTIGILLSGVLHDGTAGMLAIKRCGGVGVAQAPADAEYPGIPQSAIDAGAVDHVLRVDEMAVLLDELCRKSPPTPPPVPEELLVEARLTRRAVSSPENIQELQKLGALVHISCPECGGALWKMPDQAVDRYRCHVGHAFTATVLLAARDDEIEDALWAALRGMEERASMLETLEASERAKGRGGHSGGYGERAAESRAHAQSIRDLLALRDRP